MYKLTTEILISPDIYNRICNITDVRCRQSVKVSRDKRVRAEWPAKLDVILK